MKKNYAANKFIEWKPLKCPEHRDFVRVYRDNRTSKKGQFIHWIRTIFGLNNLIRKQCIGAFDGINLQTSSICNWNKFDSISRRDFVRVKLDLDNRKQGRGQNFQFIEPFGSFLYFRQNPQI